MTAVTQDGPVPDTILSVAEDTHADLIAMSTHGHGAMRHLLAGSVALDVLGHSPVPLILVRCRG
ncbi:MAG: universal stress protein [Dehalococcoidia bacterium]|nr:universal stress protein [Dehalococcoidia bacterium]